MAIKATKKEIVHGFACYEVAYCELQALLHYKTPTFYTCGAYGWNADVYILAAREKKIAIVMGYRPFGKKIPFEIIRKYEKCANELSYGLGSYSEKAAALDRLINAFLKEVQRL